MFGDVTVVLTARFKSCRYTSSSKSKLLLISFDKYLLWFNISKAFLPSDLLPLKFCLDFANATLKSWSYFLKTDFNGALALLSHQRSKVLAESSLPFLPSILPH